MQKRRELQPPVPARCSTYAFQAHRHTTIPALRPGCGVLFSVSFGCAPSLHHLRRLLALVRRLPRCRVGGGALARWPPSAAQTVRAVFPHTAFTKTHASEMQSKGLDES